MDDDEPIAKTKNQYISPGWQSYFGAQIVRIFIIGFCIVVFCMFVWSFASGDADVRDLLHVSAVIIVVVFLLWFNGDEIDAVRKTLAAGSIVFYSTSFGIMSDTSPELVQRMRYSDIERIEINYNRRSGVFGETLIVTENIERDATKFVDILPVPIEIEQIRGSMDEDTSKQVFGPETEVMKISSPFKINAALSLEVNEHLCAIIGIKTFVDLLLNGNAHDFMGKNGMDKSERQHAMDSLHTFLGDEVFNRLIASSPD